MKTNIGPTIFVVLLFGAGSGSAAGAEESPSRRWESAIQAFEQIDEQKPPAPGGVLFIGSSSIRRWDLVASFPGRRFINRGFGGSTIADSTYYASRIVIPYKPRAVVLYAGDNDIAQGKSVEQVVADYAEFVKTLHEALPDTKIHFIAIKPSLARWKLVEKVRDANQQIRAITEKDERLSFVDVDQPMLGDDGTPRQELFVEDGLHLSAEGYKLWTSLVGPLLEE